MSITVSTITEDLPATWYSTIIGCAALRMQVEQAPHLLTQLAATSNLEGAVHSMSKQLPHTATAAAGTCWVVAATGMDEQLKRLLQLLLALQPLLLSKPHPRLVPCKVGDGLQEKDTSTNAQRSTEQFQIKQIYTPEKIILILLFIYPAWPLVNGALLVSRGGALPQPYDHT